MGVGEAGEGVAVGVPVGDGTGVGVGVAEGGRGVCVGKISIVGVGGSGDGVAVNVGLGVKAGTVCVGATASQSANPDPAAVKAIARQATAIIAATNINNVLTCLFPTLDTFIASYPNTSVGIAHEVYTPRRFCAPAITTA
jgi:hypothetical protein